MQVQRICIHIEVEGRRIRGVVKYLVLASDKENEKISAAANCSEKNLMK